MSHALQPKKRSRAQRTLRSPLLHFIVIGTCAYLLWPWWTQDEPHFFIRLAPEDIRQLELGWEQQMGRAPTARDRSALINTEIDERLLLEEAFNRGWHRSDGIAQRRLIQNQRFIDPEDKASDAEMLERAYQQGMDRSDLVVRRRLLELMRLTLASEARRTPPLRKELEAYLRDHADQFKEPERVQLSHVFLSRDRRGADLDIDARELGERLHQTSPPLEDAVKWGDPLLVRSRLPLWSKERLARELGARFAESAMQAPLQEWFGPVDSAYGKHWVFVEARQDATDPDLDNVLPRVEAELLREREQQALRSHIEALREQAEIELATDPNAPAP